jgi:hypothetical protein
MRMEMREGAWKAGYRMGIGNSNDIRTQATTTGCCCCCCGGGGGAEGRLWVRASVSWGQERAGKSYGRVTTVCSTLLLGLGRSLSERIATLLVVRPSLFFWSSSVLPLFFFGVSANGLVLPAVSQLNGPQDWVLDSISGPCR